MFPMLTLPLVALVSVGIHAAWKRGQLGRQSQAPAGRAVALALVVGLALALGAYGAGKLLSHMGMVLGCWIILSSLFDPIDRLRRKLTLPRAIIGMTLAHIGLGVCVMAISTVESYTVERDVALAPGEIAGAGPLCLSLRQIKPHRRA